MRHLSAHSNTDNLLLQKGQKNLRQKRERGGVEEGEKELNVKPALIVSILESRAAFRLI